MLKLQQFGGGPNSVHHLLWEAEYWIDLFDLFAPKQGQSSYAKQCVERVHLYAGEGQERSRGRGRGGEEYTIHHNYGVAQQA